MAALRVPSGKGKETSVHAQYGDAVRVTTRDHEDPAVVDARTGTIIEPDPGVIADQVNSSVALERQVHLPADRME